MIRHSHLVNVPFAIQQSKQTIPFVTLFFAVSASRDDTNRQNFQSALLLPST